MSEDQLPERKSDFSLKFWLIAMLRQAYWGWLRVWLRPENGADIHRRN